MDKKLLSYFYEDLQKAISNVEADITEIRMRLNRPITIVCGRKIFYIDQNGTLSSVAQKNCIITDSINMKKTFEAICRYSIHSYQNNICDGFITLEGGHRVGICGTAIISDGKISNVKDISSLNFRVAREVINCSSEIYNAVFSCGLSNVLIAGAPSSGKTTILRDLCRKLGQHYKVSVIDEREEIAAVYGGIPQNDIGINTDVFNGYSKEQGIEMAVRVMAPDIILCDEAGGRKDFTAFEYAITSGVKIAATVHAICMNDIIRKIPFYHEFDYIVFLSTEKRNIEKLIRMRDYDKNNKLNYNNCSNGSDGELFCS